MKKVLLVLMCGVLILTGSNKIIAKEKIHYEIEELSFDDGKPCDKKKENVQIKTDAKGKVDKVNVEVSLTGITYKEPILDETILTNIKNKSGNEEFKLKDNKLIFENKGEDIKYQGSSDKELPIGIKVTYYLDDKEIEPTNLLNKSGNVKIKIEYLNNVSKEINGNTYYVPFVAISMLTMPSSIFSNIKVTNGKVMEIAGEKVVLGLGVPGLKESLKLNNISQIKDLNLPETLEIEAKVKEFKLDPINVIYSSSLLNEIKDEDLDKFSSFDFDPNELENKLNELDNVNKMLIDGGNQLQVAFSDLNYDIDNIKNRLNELDTKIIKLGITREDVDSDINSFKEVLLKIKNKFENTDQDIIKLKDISNSISKSIDYLNQLENHIKNIEVYKQNLIAIVNANNELLEELKNYDLMHLEEVAKNQVSQELNNYDLDDETKQAIINSINFNGINNDINQIVNQIIINNSSIGNLNLDEINKVIESLKNEINAIDVKNLQFDEIENDLNKLKDRIDKLNQDEIKISALANNVYDGVTLLQDNYPNVKIILNGLQEMSNGYIQYNKGVNEYINGINSIKNELLNNLNNNDLNEFKALVQRIKDIRDIGIEYDNYSGKLGNQASEVTFIIETKAIE